MVRIVEISATLVAYGSLFTAELYRPKIVK
jgi:hypothetical protein